jgi:hypothetical protein
LQTWAIGWLFAELQGTFFCRRRVGFIDEAGLKHSLYNAVSSFNCDVFPAANKRWRFA